MEIIWGFLILAIFIRIHLFLKELRRQQLKDKLLEEQEIINEYTFKKIREEIEEKNMTQASYKKQK